MRFSHGLILCLCLLVSCILPLGLLRGELLCLLVVALVPLVPLRATSVTPLRVPPACCLGGSLCSTLAVFVAPLSSVRLRSRLLSTISGCRLSSKVLFSLSGHRLPPKVFFTLSGCRLYPKLMPGTRGTPGHPTGPLVRRTPQPGHPIVGGPLAGRLPGHPIEPPQLGSLPGGPGHPTAPGRPGELPNWAIPSSGAPGKAGKEARAIPPPLPSSAPGITCTRAIPSAL